MTKVVSRLCTDRYIVSRELCDVASRERHRIVVERESSNRNVAACLKPDAAAFRIRVSVGDEFRIDSGAMEGRLRRLRPEPLGCSTPDYEVMPSALVHAAVAGLLGAALLGEAFDRRALLVVVVAATIADLDSFIALVSTAGHRTSLHNLALPTLAAVLWYVDVSVREQSLLRSRWGAWGVRVAWVAILCYAVGHVMLDLTDGYANLFWPLHDQFYTLRGEMELSNQRGLVQTFREGDGFLLLEPRGTSQDVQITTGVDPGTTTTGETAERTFPLFGSGLELLVTLVGGLVTAARFRLSAFDE